MLVKNNTRDVITPCARTQAFLLSVSRLASLSFIHKLEVLSEK